MSRMPAHQMGRQQGFMMDPHAGKLKVRQIHNIHRYIPQFRVDYLFK